MATGATALAAWIYALACVGVMGFQIALIAGAPWGHLTQGGQVSGALPLRGRLAAFASIFILAGLALAVLSAAGLWPGWPRWTAYLALGLQGLVTLANIATPSVPERRLWGPIETVLLVLALFVILAG